MKFRIERLPQEVINDPDLGPIVPPLTVLMGDKEAPPDLNFHPPSDQLAEYDEYLYEIMEGIFGVCEGVTEEEIREFLLSKGYEEVEESTTRP